MNDDNRAARSIVSANTPPSVNVIGCGGAGINMVRLALDKYGDLSTTVYLDTSNANTRLGEGVIMVGHDEGGGSGLVRRQHAEHIEDKLADMSESDLGLADINIVVFSLSGGSGSTIGPMVIEEIMTRRDSIAVGIVIMSTEDQVHTTNTIKTIESLTAIAENEDLIIPLMVFDNRKGRKSVDATMPSKIASLVNLLTLPTREIDRNDRINWINVKKTLPDAGSGLRLLHVEVEEEANRHTLTEIWPSGDGHLFDSVINIATDTREIEPLPTARVIFSGVFDTIRLVPMMGLIGDPTDSFGKLIKELKAAQSRAYKTRGNMKY